MAHFAMNSALLGVYIWDKMTKKRGKTRAATKEKLVHSFDNNQDSNYAFSDSSEEMARIFEELEKQEAWFVNLCKKMDAEQAENIATVNQWL